MKKFLALCLCLCFIVLNIPAASADGEVYLRTEVGYGWDYYFASLGQELILYSTLENVSEEDSAAFKTQFKYTMESTDYDEATGFKWKKIESDGAKSIKWTPTQEGLYCISAEGVLASTGKTISSIDRGLSVVLVVDMEKKTVVKTADELIQAANSGAHYISVEGDIALDKKDVHISQQTVFEVVKGYSLSLNESNLHFGIGRWNMGSTVLVDGNIIVNEGSSIQTGEYPVDLFVSGRITGYDVESVKNIQYIPSNVSPFEEFTGSYLEDKNTGITTVIDEMSNTTVLSVTTLSYLDPIFTAMENLDKGEVIKAFESDISNHEGEYTLTVPIDAKYNEKKLTVYLLDKSISGYTEPQKLKVECLEGKIQITVDSNDIVMIKAPAPLLDGISLVIAIVGIAALAVMILVIAASASKRKKQRK